MDLRQAFFFKNEYPTLKKGALDAMTSATQEWGVLQGPKD